MHMKVKPVTCCLAFQKGVVVELTHRSKLPTCCTCQNFKSTPHSVISSGGPSESNHSGIVHNLFEQEERM
eukprot:6465415-Amphidinium_carterae.2